MRWAGPVVPARRRRPYRHKTEKMRPPTRAPGAVHLARGRISAEATLHRGEGPGVENAAQPVWRSDIIQVMYPRESALGVPARDDRDIRLQTARIFADSLVKNFYDHKVPRQP